MCWSDGDFDDEQSWWLIGVDVVYARSASDHLGISYGCHDVMARVTEELSCPTSIDWVVEDRWVGGLQQRSVSGREQPDGVG